MSLKTKNKLKTLAPASYAKLLQEIKARIRTARVKAHLAANSEMIRLYWHVGQSIVRRQIAVGWGKAIVERLSGDIRASFPNMTGFSPQNIWSMRAFYLAYTEGVSILLRPVRELDGRNLPQAMRGIPWGQNLDLIYKLKDPIQRLWYARKVIEHGWSRAVLVHQIESGLYERQGKAITNFKRTLPPAQSDLAREIIKDPYNFDFLTLTEGVKERKMEEGLLEHIRKFLVELGLGFCFVGSQYRLTLSNKEYFVDLLFFHRHLRCLVAIELKMTDFIPEYAGKMNFYLNLLDDQVRLPEENPSIGIILCKAKDHLEVEYAIRGIAKPMSVAQYVLAKKLPKKLAGELPSPEQLKRSLLKQKK